MTITAKFDSRCVECGKKIKRGQTVVWEKGVGVYCNKCRTPEKKTATSSPSRPPRQGRWVTCWECGRKYYDNDWYPGKDTYCGC